MPSIPANIRAVGRTQQESLPTWVEDEGASLQRRFVRRATCVPEHAYACLLVPACLFVPACACVCLSMPPVLPARSPEPPAQSPDPLRSIEQSVLTLLDHAWSTERAENATKATHHTIHIPAAFLTGSCFLSARVSATQCLVSACLCVRVFFCPLGLAS